MTHEEKLKILNDLPYAIIWPDPSWEDVSSTERQLWVNSEGYGYFLCDEPNPYYWKGEGLDLSKWNDIRNKIEKESLTFEDIKNTALEVLLNKLYAGYDFDDKEYLNDNLKPLLELKNGACGYIYAMCGDYGPLFFDSEETFKAEYERDWAEEEWEDLDDEILSEWIFRLSKENNPELSEWRKKNLLEK